MARELSGKCQETLGEGDLRFCNWREEGLKVFGL